MAEELAEVLRKFDLSSRESGGIILEDEDDLDGCEKCRMSLFGKVIGDRVTNFTGVRNFAAQMWGSPKNLTVIELGANTFQFSFSGQEDMDRALNGQPYLLDNQMLNIKRWEEGIDSSPEAFATAPLWVQIWNLPVHWVTKAIGWKIGGIFERVEDVIIPTGGSREGRHIKLKVMVNVNLALLRGSTVTMKGITRWVEFRYERCPDFCYCCGRIGHNDKSCKHGDKLKGSLKPQYGLWMRAQYQRSSPKKAHHAKTDRKSEEALMQESISKRLLFEGEYLANNRRVNHLYNAEKKSTGETDSIKLQEIAVERTMVTPLTTDKLKIQANEMVSIPEPNHPLMIKCPGATIDNPIGMEGNPLGGVPGPDDLKQTQAYSNNGSGISPQGQPLGSKTEGCPSSAKKLSGRRGGRTGLRAGLDVKERRPLKAVDMNIDKPVTSTKRKILCRDENEDSMAIDEQQVKRSKSTGAESSLLTGLMVVETSQNRSPTTQ